MDQLNHEYIELLASDKPASTKFWDLEKRIRQDKKKPGVVIQMRRSSAYWDIATMVNDGTITLDDLDEFSDDLKDAVKLILGYRTEAAESSDGSHLEEE